MGSGKTGSLGWTGMALALRRKLWVPLSALQLRGVDPKKRNRGNELEDDRTQVWGGGDRVTRNYN